MSSYSYASRHRGGMSTTTVLAAAAASLACMAVPRLLSVAGAVFQHAWAVARFWLAPPYLFVTVHLIILVIWKLSDHKHFQAHHKEPWPVVAQQHAAHPPAEVAPAVKAKEEVEDFSPDSGGGDSCVTTESDEDASSASSYCSSSVETRRSVVVAPVPERGVLERELSLPAQTADDDLDATWNAIMQKTRSAPAAQKSPPPRARDPSVGAEEMNRRFEAFIKKNRNSFWRQ